jgi:hypothetical protein
MVMHSAVVFQRKKLGGRKCKVFLLCNRQHYYKSWSARFFCPFPMAYTTTTPYHTYQLESSIFSKGELKRRGRRNVVQY